MKVKENRLYHSGQLEVQRRMGVEEAAARALQSLRPAIPPVAADFLGNQTTALLGWEDGRGRVWASALFGEPGFMAVEGGSLIRLSAEPLPGDPLSGVRDGSPVGMLAIELESRKRMVVAGKLWRDSRQFTLQAERVLSQCPKYIQPRPWRPGPLAGSETPVAATTDLRLDPRQREWIERADTFFLASLHPETGAGVSHRGGQPGFVHVLDERTLEFPDYPGNRMFLTLGNIAAHPNSGLLFVDFAKGALLQITGKARVLWDESSIRRHPGAQLAVRFQIEEINRFPSFSGYPRAGSPSSPASRK